MNKVLIVTGASRGIGAAMRRGGQPDEVARAILWLLSDSASFTTGAFIDVTGGK
jgi:NAD(P)-dependent dehydrogenase (short-subunit alcohol dehydrogenase family)